MVRKCVRIFKGHENCGVETMLIKMHWLWWSLVINSSIRRSMDQTVCCYEWDELPI